VTSRALATINVFGRDRAGVVAKVTGFLFQSGGNIEELVEQVSRREFHMNVAASWAPGRLDRDAVARGLAALARDLGMEITARFVSPRGRPRMAIFVSRETHCLDALLKAVQRGRLRADPVLLVSNHRGMASEARRWRLPFLHASWRNREASEARVLRRLANAETDLIVLARFMRILSPSFAWRYRNRIINVHPSLLPAFRGSQAYRQAYDFGVKVVGATAHFVTPDLDGGPIICQEAMALKPHEPLESIMRRGRAVEARVLLKAVRLHLAHRLDVHWGKVALV
jgi:formyltetrahydrofolate deformylase